MVDPMPECVAELDDDAWSTYSAVIERFETAWQTRGDATIADFLPAADDPGRRRALLALIKIDQEYRWRAGGRPLVEYYLDQWPELGRDDEISAELLTAECLTRAGFDRPVQPAELEQRFPHIAGQIDLAELEQQALRETTSITPDTDSAHGELSETVVGLAEPISCEQFVSRLTAAGLMTAEAVEQCLARLPGEERPAGGLDLARRLVELGKLTAHQAQTLCQGRDDPLVLGNYVILDRLGHGGMGHVFKAVHRRMDRIVALKMLTPELVGTPDSLRRFQQEVKAAARLSHPNIVIAHDADEADGRPFLVMEYVDGFDLATLVRQQGPLPVEMAVDCTLQAARGLQYAHEHGVVHRDIKPANLILECGDLSPLSLSNSASPEEPPAATEVHFEKATGPEKESGDKSPHSIGPVKILDMGLAHLDSADAREDELTGAGQVMGTVDFMAPEQAIDAHRADGRADIYSLGATLHYLLTGQSMYAGRTTVAKLLAHQTEPIPSLAVVLPHLPPALDAVFRRMVAKRPEERYQKMAELIADLEALRPQLGVARLGTPSRVGAGDQARSARVSDPAETADRRSPGNSPDDGHPNAAAVGRPPWRRRWPVLAAAGASGLLLIWLGIWVVIRDERGQEVARVRLPDGGSVTQEPEPISPRPGTPGEEVRSGRRTGPGPGEGPTTSPCPGTPGRGGGGEGPWNLPPDAPPPAIAPFDAASAKAHQAAWANYLGVPIEMQNSIGMKFMLIPPGEFDMGAREAEVTRLLAQEKGGKLSYWYRDREPTERPRHRVRITKPFWLGRYEVTRGQFRRFVDERGYRTEAERDGKGGAGEFRGKRKLDPRFVWNGDLGFEQTDDHPVILVSWNDATAFCAWLSEKEGEKSHLPTEAQWEYACRAGSTTMWHFGDEVSALGEYARFGPRTGEGTHPVGQKKPNPWGLYDMHGNVWELCQDWWGDWYYATSPRDDPQGPSEGLDRVHRGGCWLHPPALCRSASRSICGLDHRTTDCGFRVARTIPWPEVGRVTADAERPAATPVKKPPSPETPSPRATAPAAEVGPGRRTGPGGGAGPWNLPPDAPPPAIAPFDAAKAKAHQEAWAKYLRVPVEIANSIGMKLTLIPPGEFDMGSAEAEVAEALKREKAREKPDLDRINRLSAEVPQHRVRITRPFWLGRHEVTRGQFRRFVEDRGYRTEAERDGKGGFGLLDDRRRQDPRFVWNADPGFEQTDEHPVVQVSWSDASAFCAWLSQKEQATVQLLTEAQWEYACRAGTTTAYCCGDRWQGLETHAWFDMSVNQGTHPVGQKSANAWGLFDMHGNIWEWCADWYDPAYYATSPRDDPAGPPAGPYHVSRGGSWANSAGECQSSYRCGWQEPGGRADCRGFRIARLVSLPSPSR